MEWQIIVELCWFCLRYPCDFHLNCTPQALTMDYWYQPQNREELQHLKGCCKTISMEPCFLTSRYATFKFKYAYSSLLICSTCCVSSLWSVVLVFFHLNYSWRFLPLALALKCLLSSLSTLSPHYDRNFCFIFAFSSFELWLFLCLHVKQFTVTNHSFGRIFVLQKSWRVYFIAQHNCGFFSILDNWKPWGIAMLAVRLSLLPSYARRHVTQNATVAVEGVLRKSAVYFVQE